MIDDVRAAIDLRFCEFAPLHRIGPGRARRAGHVLQHLGLRVGVFHALHVAAGKLVDQRNVHAADETDLAGLGGLGGQKPDQERTLLFLEHDRLNVGLVHHHVDDDELRLGELRRHLLHGTGLAEADGDDGAQPVARELAHRLLALGIVLDLEIAERDPRVFLELLGAVERAFVEALVELAADIVDQSRLDVGGPCGSTHRDGQARARQKSRYPARPRRHHGPSPCRATGPFSRATWHGLQRSQSPGLPRVRPEDEFGCRSKRGVDDSAGGPARTPAKRRTGWTARAPGRSRPPGRRRRGGAPPRCRAVRTRTRLRGRCWFDVRRRSTSA